MPSQDCDKTDEESDFTLISYTADDRPWAEWVAQVLESAGLSVRMQAWDVPAGANFVEWIGEQLQCAHHVITLYSKSYFESYWCRQEWTSALAARSLVPIRIEDVTPPPPLDTRNYIDVFNIDESTAQRRILEAVNVLPVLRRATAGFPGKAADSKRAPGTQEVQKSKGEPSLLTGDQWLKDLSDLDKAKGLIDDNLRIELERLILSRRFSDYYANSTMQGASDDE